MSKELEESEEERLTGYVSYTYLFAGSNLVGVRLNTIRSKTTRTPFILKVGIDEMEIPDYFKPHFLFEKLGLLVFLTSESSVLMTPIEINSSLIVKVE